MKRFVSARLLVHLGRGGFIDPTVTLRCPGRIHISDDCRLYHGAVLNGRTNCETGIYLGNGVKVHEYAYLDPYGGFIYLEDNVLIGHHCVIAGHGGLRVGRDSMISGLTYIVPSNHVFARRGIPYRLQGESRKGITIGANVWIGSNCVVLDGVSIGDNTVVGAGSVVSRSLPPDVVALGVPARVIRALGQ